MSDCITYPLQWQLGEYCWLAGTPSYLIKPAGEIDHANDKHWRETFHVSQQPIQVVGAELSNGVVVDGRWDKTQRKVYYKFPGGGNDDGSQMFRTHQEAADFVAEQNRRLTR